MDKSIFKIALGTECEPKNKQSPCPEPETFLQYKDVEFGIGMDEQLYIKEDNTWRKAQSK